LPDHRPGAPAAQIGHQLDDGVLQIGNNLSYFGRGIRKIATDLFLTILTTRFEMAAVCSSKAACP
jgi:hypothetical protein